MKMENILTVASVLSLALLAGQASADVSGYTSNINSQTVNAGASKWLDLNTFVGNQINKFCHFKAGPAAIYFSAETAKSGGGTVGWLNTRIWLDPPGVGPGKNPFLLAPTNQTNNYAMDSAKDSAFDWEGHAVHGGFQVPMSGFYRVRVHARSIGNASYSIDDTSVICMN